MCYNKISNKARTRAYNAEQCKILKYVTVKSIGFKCPHLIGFEYLTISFHVHFKRFRWQKKIDFCKFI